MLLSVYRYTIVLWMFSLKHDGGPGSWIFNVWLAAPSEDTNFIKTIWRWCQMDDTKHCLIVRMICGGPRFEIFGRFAFFGFQINTPYPHGSLEDVCWKGDGWTWNFSLEKTWVYFDAHDPICQATCMQKRLCLLYTLCKLCCCGPCLTIPFKLVTLRTKLCKHFTKGYCKFEARLWAAAAAESFA